MLYVYYVKEMGCVFSEANRSYAWQEFANAAEEAGTDILMLKGIYLRNFYPDPECRDMCDIDFLYNPEQSSKLEAVFCSLGYEKRKATTCHDGWFNPENGVTFEAHHILNSDEDKEKEYYAGLWSRAVKVEGKNHVFHMTAQDMYIHLLLHIRTHFKTESVTLRQLADLYVMKLYSKINAIEADKFLRELGLSYLAKSMDGLLKLLFENDEDSANSSELIELADYIFGNVSFGEYSQADAREAYKSGGSKIKAFFKMAFPKAERIYKSYPFIAKHRILLLFGYIYRLVQIIGIRKNNTKKKLKLLSGVSPSAAEQGKKINDFFEKYGI